MKGVCLVFVIHVLIQKGYAATYVPRANPDFDCAECSLITTASSLEGTLTFSSVSSTDEPGSTEETTTEATSSIAAPVESSEEAQTSSAVIHTTSQGDRDVVLSSTATAPGIDQDVTIIVSDILTQTTTDCPIGDVGSPSSLGSPVSEAVPEPSSTSSEVTMTVTSEVVVTGTTTVCDASEDASTSAVVESVSTNYRGLSSPTGISQPYIPPVQSSPPPAFSGTPLPTISTVSSNVGPPSIILSPSPVLPISNIQPNRSLPINSASTLQGSEFPSFSFFNSTTSLSSDLFTMRAPYANSSRMPESSYYMPVSLTSSSYSAIISNTILNATSSADNGGNMKTVVHSLTSLLAVVLSTIIVL